MDGMSGVQAARRDAPEVMWQHTLAGSISCVGIGLHGARSVRLTLHPAEANTGIVFVRADLGHVTIPAHHDHVVDTRLCTVVGAGAARVGTVEHLLAAFAGAGIDNAWVEVDAPELPILDGSAEPFLFLIDCAGVVAQNAPRRVIEVRRPVRVEQDGSWAELTPASSGLHMDVGIDFAATAIGRQTFGLSLTQESFRHELAGARTFAVADEIDQLRQAGLALGGSLENAVVVDGAAVLNPGGLRMEAEFVRHKMLDMVGDLALAGGLLRAHVRAWRPGHALNQALLGALFADRANWRLDGARAPALMSAA